jgi:hypothetical protein
MFETKRRRSLSLHPTPLIRDRDIKERKMPKKIKCTLGAHPPLTWGMAHMW